jgi:hypothetical protein
MMAGSSVWLYRYRWHDMYQGFGDHVKLSCRCLMFRHLLSGRMSGLKTVAVFLVRAVFQTRLHVGADWNSSGRAFVG